MKADKFTTPVQQKVAMDNTGPPVELHKAAAPDLERRGKITYFATDNTQIPRKGEKTPHHYINILANPGHVRKLVSLLVNEETEPEI